MAKVMVVDDAHSELRLMESMLAAGGHQVLTYADGHLVEDALLAEQPDVVLLDIVMPGRNGYEVLRALKRDARTRATPVVIVSSKSQQSDRLWGQRQGADGYLAKPFTAEQLLATVARAVGRP